MYKRIPKIEWNTPKYVNLRCKNCNMEFSAYERQVAYRKYCGYTCYKMGSGRLNRKLAY
jgi:hypothetical protein